MNKKRIAQYCCAALVAAGVGLNIQNAIADYGIGENSLSLVAVGGTNSGSNSNSNSDILVHNGYVSVVSKVHKGWKLSKTNTKKTHGTHQDIWQVYKEASWNECKEITLEEYNKGNKNICKAPTSKKEAGITVTGSVKPDGEWFCPQDK